MAVLSLCPHMLEGARYLSRASFIRALIPFMRALPSWLSHISTLVTQSYLTGSHLQMLGVGFQHVNSMGVRNTKSLKGQIDFRLPYPFKIHSLEIFPWNCPKRSFSDYSYVIQTLLAQKLNCPIPYGSQNFKWLKVKSSVPGIKLCVGTACS